MNRDLVTSSYLLYKIANARQPLSSGGKFNMNPAYPEKPGGLHYSGLSGGLGIYIENPGFPDFVEMVQ